MAGSQRRRCSTKQSVAQQSFKDESDDDDMRDPFGPDDTSDTDDESDVSEWGKKRSKKATLKVKPKRKSIMTKPQRPIAPPAMSDVEYDEDPDSPELGGFTEVRKPVSTPKKVMPGANRLAVQTRSNDGTAMSSAAPSVVQIHLNAGAGAGGTTINLDLSDLVLGKRGFDEIGTASLPTPDGSNAPESPTRIVINNKTGRIRSATPGHSSKRIRVLEDMNERVHSAQKAKKGFCDLPFELRVR